MAKLFMWVSFSIMLAAFIVTELYRGVWESVFVLTVLLSSFVMIGLINWAYRQIMAEDERINQQLLKTVKEQLVLVKRIDSDRLINRDVERENLYLLNEILQRDVEELRTAKARAKLEAEARKEYNELMTNKNKEFATELDYGEL